jgi:hypothetical protein
MVTDRKKDSPKTPAKQGPEEILSEPNRISGCGSHCGQILENLIEQTVEGCPKRGRGDAQNGD